MTRRPKPRRGVVILVVLSLLVLFVLLAVTYAIVSGQYDRAARSSARQEALGVEPQKDLDKAFYQILRDTTQRSSAARFHSILRDFYGEDGFRGTLVDQTYVHPPVQANLQGWNTDTTNNDVFTNGGAAYAISGGQFLDLWVNPTIAFTSTDGEAYTLNTIEGFYNGCVLTILSGPARGWSTTIVGYFQVSGVPVLRVLNLKTDAGATLAWADLDEAQFLVNGRPFNGTGFGFRYAPHLDSAGTPMVDPTTGAVLRFPKLDASAPVSMRLPDGTSQSVTVQSDTLPATDPPLALMPNHAARGTLNPLPAVVNQLLQGGTDEGYDAPDYQTMFLAMVPPNTTDSSQIIPSFHRPALLNYWTNRTDPSDPSLRYWDSDTTYADLKRMVSLRPVEPNFDGSNPTYAAAYTAARAATPDTTLERAWYVNGPWDVDNDGDGIADSIWIDLGLPTQTAPDGRRYKPLFAILCVDLDGRLNVNAHGNPAPFYANRPLAARLWYHPAPPPSDLDTSAFPNGMGYGPGEIALGSVTTTLSTLLSQRYGGDDVPGLAGLDPLARIKFFEESENYFQSATYGLSSYSTPPDLRGELSMGMDVFGQMLFEQVPAAVTESRADSPYEINLVGFTNGDRPFTPAELERVLRRFDIDAAQLPNRLSSNLDLSSVDLGRLVTTDSFDPPVPGVALVSDMLNNSTAFGTDYQPKNLMELLWARGASPATMKGLMSSETLLGQRLDINRPLGDGRDKAAPQNNGMVDEMLDPTDPAHEQRDETIWSTVTAPGFVQPIRLYHTNGADVAPIPVNGTLDALDHLWARQLLARHIYVLLMALTDENYGTEFVDPQMDADGDGTISAGERALALAQWAINFVDYRDADSTMTQFFYDATPFDVGGWDPDGTLSVWGCERPELVISEVLAFHDRRTEDLANDDGADGGPPGSTTTDTLNADGDFDQRLMPRGSLFVELFNPWTSGADVKPAELYAGGGVQLDRVATDGTFNSPVWRLRYVPDNGSGQDPDDPVVANQPDPATVRDMYFIDPSAYAATSPDLSLVTTATPPDGIYATTLGAAPVLPGRYAVVGSPGLADGNGNYITPLGRLAGITQAEETDLGSLRMDETRRIVLSPGAAGNQVHVYNNDDTAAPVLTAAVPDDPADAAISGTLVPFGAIPGEANDADILPATAIVLNVPWGVSVSEPREGYVAAQGVAPADSTTTGTFEGFYQIPIDVPFDNGTALMINQTAAWGTIHLQRLADPLRTYSPSTNPYRTIDSARVDLTTFNGVSATQDPGSSAAGVGRRLFSVQRGDTIDATGLTPMRREFWPQERVVSNPAADVGLDATATHYFSFYLRSSLGYLNHGFWPYQGAIAAAYRGSPAVDVNDAFVENDSTLASLFWNNRPYISQYELLQVPGQRSSKLLERFSRSPVAGAPTPYDPDPSVGSPQYGHMSNFFQSSPFTEMDQAPHLYRLLEYVHVPSRYVGTELVLNPSRFKTHRVVAVGNAPNQITNPTTLNPSFLTPFNRISQYRDPGRVNINTIYDARVWDALFGGYQHLSFSELVATRRGYIDSTNPLFGPHPNLPTSFANPFRPPGHGSLVPLRELERQDIETTLLRSTAVLDVATSATSNAPDPSAAPLLEGGYVAASTASTVATHPSNSFFRYNDLRRLGNMITTRSNVYALWITVGYFEVEPNVVGGVPVADDVHPDGYRVGQEMGLDTGEVKRHRAFYMIDRTIPVAFQPGENHNVDRCVLLRRFIE